MNQLVEEGYEPAPMPPLGNPTRMEDGSLRFLARDDATRKRAEAALASQAVETWVFFNGEEDENVLGRVASVEPAHALAYFTVQPNDG
jgi:hypothetical protein